MSAGLTMFEGLYANERVTLKCVHSKYFLFVASVFPEKLDEKSYLLGTEIFKT